MRMIAAGHEVRPWRCGFSACAPHVGDFGRDRDIHMVIRLHYPGQSRTEGLEQVARFAEEVAPARRAAAGS